MVGSSICKELKKYGYGNENKNGLILAPNRNKLDLSSFQSVNDWFNKNLIEEPNLINYLDLVSLGTVCDVVPLIGLNRAIVKQGLKILKAKKNLGLKNAIIWMTGHCTIQPYRTP